MALHAEHTVVVVDDDEAVLLYLSETLKSGGFECRSFPGAAAAAGWLAVCDERIDLLLSDISMPGMTGLDLLRTTKIQNPDMPFILISGVCDLPTARGALRAGASDYLLKPVDPEDLLGIVSRHINVVHSEELAAVKAALRQTLGSGTRSEADRARRLLPIFDGLGFKRFETLQHSQRVAAFSLLMARDIGFSDESLRRLEIGALLHDIGKAGVPHNVLRKPGPLNGHERAIMMMHPRLGLDLISDLPGLAMERQIVYSHHEFFDGTGYPEGLAGEEIPLPARIFSIADALDAITSDRCYRSGQSLQAARIEIHRATGSQFDPAIVELFDRVSDDEFEAVRDRFPDAL